MKRNVLIAAALAGAVALSASAANAAEHACAGTVSQQIAAVGVSPSDVEKVTYSVNSDGNNNNRGWNAWVQLKGEPGYLVVDTRPDCGLRQVYTRGGLKLSGVKAF